MKLTQNDITRVKGLGCLRDKRTEDCFNVRVITVNGKLTADKMQAVAEASRLFGSGEVTMTSRMTLEIQGVKYESLEDLFEFLNKHGLESGGTGPKVRPVVSCKGTTCQYGLIDTFSLSEKIHERFYKGMHDVTLPHKFKIAVGGCPNSCVKPETNDIGIVGQRVPVFNEDKCKSCKVCSAAEICAVKAASFDGGFKIKETCNGCGRCIAKCPFGAVEEKVNGYKMYIGGRWGKKKAMAMPLSKVFASEEELLDAVERAILFFKDEGIAGERFSDTIARLGFEYAESKIIK
ncbi:MAG: 4Fe-4S binding protein [Clostridia bacterium]|nr:4Fe-4S binding protein [Clostridia bacterium]